MAIGPKLDLVSCRKTSKYPVLKIFNQLEFGGYGESWYGWAVEAVQCILCAYAGGFDVLQNELFDALIVIGDWV